MTPLLGFIPDADPATPGAIIDCVQMIPTERGMKSAPSAVAVSGLGALSAECRGASVVQKTSGTRRTLAGTQTRLYEVSGSTWNAVSATYSGSSENRWMFAQFGDVTLATNDTEQIQYATATTFAAVAGAPKARLLITTKDFAIAFNTDDATAAATYGDSPDRWWCSAFQDCTSWTPNVDLQAATGRLIGGGGEIVSAAVFGTGAVAYKTREMFLGVYVGAPSVFDWQRVPGDQGCVGPEAVVDIGGAHIFVGEDNIWMYDGSRPTPIAQGSVRQWFLNDISATYRYRTIVSYDRNNGVVWIFYPSLSSTGKPDSALVYHLATQKWGRANRSIEAAMNYVTPGVTWDTLSSVGSTWDTLPDQPWDSQAWQASGRALAIFDTSHNLKTLTGSGEDCGFTTGYVGDDDQHSFCSGVRLRFFTEPTTGTVTGATKANIGETGLAAGAGTFANHKFDLRQSGRWHRFSFLFTGNVEVGGVRASLKKAGMR